VLVLQLKFVVRVMGDLNSQLKLGGLILFERESAIQCLKMNKKIGRCEMVINI